MREMWRPSDPEKERLRDLYSQCELTVDRLPYSEEFEAIYQDFGNKSVSKSELFFALANMRKRKELPRKAK